MEQALTVDTVLVRQAEDDFELLVREHSRVLFKIAYSVLRNAVDAEDIVQEAFLRAFEGSRWRKAQSSRAWLARITWRLAVERSQRQSAHVHQEISELPPNDPGIEPRLIAAEKSELLRQMICTLPVELKQAIELSTVQELTSAEIGELLGVAEGTVRTRLMRARALLKEKVSVLLGGGAYAR